MALLLRPSMLDDFGLLAAVEWQGREISKRTGLVVEVMDHNFDDDLPDDHKTCIYRVVQEALNNCTAHAKATHARVLLTGGARHYVLSISDDGVGFDPARKFGMGLLGMQERVARLGGTFLVESAPGRGTSIRVELPVAHSSPTEILVL
jgi:signal transduction histidine kinase